MSIDTSLVCALSELVFEQAVTLGSYLESFSKLDIRVVVTMEDMNMVLRKKVKEIISESSKNEEYSYQRY